MGSAGVPAILGYVNPEDSVCLTYLGHSTVLIAIDGLRLLTDPILRMRVGPLVRAQPPIEPSHWTGIDGALISHSHWDHLDIGSLELLGYDTHLVVPLGLGERLRQRGFRHVSEVRPRDTVEMGGVSIRAIHARHHGFGPPLGPSGLAVGYLVEGTVGIYFAGDTAFFTGMADLSGHVDVALLPVWGWGPWTRSSEHLDPLGAARALSLIRPRLAVPIHWGTLHPVGMGWLRPGTRVHPPRQFARLAGRHAPGTTVRILPVGASLEVAPRVGVGPTGRTGANAPSEPDRQPGRRPGSPSPHGRRRAPDR